MKGGCCCCHFSEAVFDWASYNVAIDGTSCEAVVDGGMARFVDVVICDLSLELIIAPKVWMMDLCWRLQVVPG